MMALMNRLSRKRLNRTRLMNSTALSPMASDRPANAATVSAISSDPSSPKMAMKSSVEGASISPATRKKVMTCSQPFTERPPPSPRPRGYVAAQRDGSLTAEYYPAMTDSTTGGDTHDSAALLLSETVEDFRRQKGQADRALAQLADADWHATLGEESNSIAVIVQHLAGNLRSRWRDFLTTDGEKPDRDRDAEFEDAALSPADLLAQWEEGWRVALASLDALTVTD